MADNLLFFTELLAMPVLDLKGRRIGRVKDAAIVPLVHVVSDRRTMGEHAVKGVLRACAWLIAIVVVGLNGGLIVQVVRA